MPALIILGATGTVLALRTLHDWGAMRRLLSDERLGRQRRAALAFEADLEQPETAAPIRVKLTGEWVTTVTGVRSGEYDVACAIENANIEGQRLPNAGQAAVAELRRRLARRFWVTYRSDGAALRIHFPKEASASDRNLLQMIVADTQLVGAKGESAQWTALERDGVGAYLAAYQRSARDTVLKRKLKYVAVDGAAGIHGSDELSVKVDHSEHRFTLAPTGEMVGCEASDQLRIGMPLPQGGWLAVRTATHLSQARFARDPELVGSLERARPQVDSAAIRSQRSDPELALSSRDQQLLDGHSSETLLAEAQAKRSDQLLPLRLAALFRRRPPAIASAMTLIRQRGSLKLVTDALAVAGNRESIDALAQLARDTAAPLNARSEALRALVLLPQPSAVAMRSAMELIDDHDLTLRRTAQLISAALARSGREQYPTEAEAIDRMLLARESKAESTEERIALLAALGNSAAATVLPAIEHALHDSRGEVRTAAARALRLADDAAVNDWLAAAISDDHDPRVRSAAIFAAGFRPRDRLIPALLRVATDDPVVFVRADAIGLLRRWRDASPRIAPTLARIAERDASASMRRVAHNALAPQQAE